MPRPGTGSQGRLRLLARMFLLLALCFGNCAAAEQRSHYEVLGVPQDAAERAIKKAYHALSLQVRPDGLEGASPPTIALFLSQTIVAFYWGSSGCACMGDGAGSAADRPNPSQYHPDKNPAPEAVERFQEARAAPSALCRHSNLPCDLIVGVGVGWVAVRVQIAAAYEELSDPESRRRYDLYGPADGSGARRRARWADRFQWVVNLPLKAVGPSREFQWSGARGWDGGRRASFRYGRHLRVDEPGLRAGAGGPSAARAQRALWSDAVSCRWRRTS
jgi:hypothetical protein